MNRLCQYNTDCNFSGIHIKSCVDAFLYSKKYRPKLRKTDVHAKNIAKSFSFFSFSVGLPFVIENENVCFVRNFHDL